MQHNVEEITQAAIYRGEPGAQGTLVSNITITPGFGLQTSFSLAQTDLTTFLDGVSISG